MKIGIDISQLAYPGTGVANYLENFIAKLLEIDQNNEYVLFFSSLRREFQISNFKYPIANKNVTVKTFKIPPTLLDLLWNKLHILQIETLIGYVDLFITSDWTEPPARQAKKITILYDLIVYKHPKETAENIVAVQKRKLAWVKKESEMIFCISNATMADAEQILGLQKDKLAVLYPGVTL